MIPLQKLEPECFYWATLKADREAPAEVVRVSTIFGAEREYWSIARLGSDEHRMPADFEFVTKIVPPSSKMSLELAAE